MHYSQIEYESAKALISAGYNVSISHSRTTDSVYIRIDNGILDTLRISDHREPHRKKPCSYSMVDDNKYTYSQLIRENGNSVYELTQDKQGIGILLMMVAAKKRKIMKICETEQAYKQRMQEIRNSMDGTLGFWETAVDIATIEDLDEFYEGGGVHHV